MGSATIRIEPADATDFRVHLIEQDGRRTSAVLARTDLTSGRWTANLGAQSPPPATDIVTQVAGVTPERRSHPDYREIAETLYRWLLPAGALRDRWLDIDQIDNWQLYVETTVEALVQLPWEMACPDTHPLRRPALIGGLCRLAPRINGIARGPAASQSSAWPFRILIVIGCKADDEETLHVGSEILAIQRIFHPLGRTVDIHPMYRPAKSEMMAWIKRFRPHVLHFAGHGKKAAGANQYGLRVESDGGGWTWTGDAIDVDLPKERWVPKFVFLNACRSAGEESGSWNAHRSFLAAGAKAVLGMQADVRGDHSGAFASTLYRSLAEGACLEEALNQARMTILDALPAGPGDLSWSLPAMTTTEPNTILFKPPPLPFDETFEKCGEFEEARLFANCREPRRLLTNWAYPCVASEKTPNILLVVGEQNTGKSHLLKWCMENWVIGGARVRYIKLHDGTPKTFLSVLRQIRDGEADNNDVKTHYLHSALAKSAFRQFNWHLNNLVSTGAAGEWVEAEHPETEVPDDNQRLTALTDKRLEKEIGALFLEALRRASSDKPLILVLDQIEGLKGERLLPVDEFEQLVQHLLVPIANDPSLPVKIAVIATNMQVSDFKLSQIPSRGIASHDVPASVPDSDLTALAAEMLWFQDESKVTEFAKILFQLPDDQQPPLKGLARLAIVWGMIQMRKPTYLNAVRRMR